MTHLSHNCHILSFLLQIFTVSVLKKQTQNDRLGQKSELSSSSGLPVSGLVLTGGSLTLRPHTWWIFFFSVLMARGFIFKSRRFFSVSVDANRKKRFTRIWTLQKVLFSGTSSAPRFPEIKGRSSTSINTLYIWIRKTRRCGQRASVREGRGATSLTDFMHMQAAEPEREKDKKKKKMTRIFSSFFLPPLNLFSRPVTHEWGQSSEETERGRKKSRQPIWE